MLGNFSYCNPAKLYFGDQSLDYLNTELPKYGKNVVLIYGGGSIKKNGIYDDVIKILEAQGKNVAEIAGVMPNPTLAKLYEGIEIARKHQADLLLAVGGGSVCDYAKAVSVSVNCGEDPWLPHRQMVAGIYDIFNHICEQYFSGEDDNTSDYISEGLMRSVLHASRIANRNPQDYEARSNLMWTATWALNTLIAKGKSTDWMVHMLGQAVGAYTNATHGMTLAAVSLPYYRYILPYGLPKFKRFAIEVWKVNPEGKADEEIAEEGLKAMEDWMKELGLAMKISELGATKDMIDGIADATLLLEGGYKVLSRKEVVEILKESL